MKLVHFKLLVLCAVFVCFQKMRLFQKNLEDLSSRISAADAMRNGWQAPSDMTEVGEMLEQLRVKSYSSVLQQSVVEVEWLASLLCTKVSGSNLSSDFVFSVPPAKFWDCTIK
jgi:hypothetical protein